MDTATVNTSKKFYKTTLPSDIIFTKADASTSDEKVEKLTRELNIHYRACIGSLIYLLSTRVDFSFSVQKLAKFSENPGKLQFEGLVHLLGYIRNNKTLGLKNYYDMKDAPLSDLLRQANINTENQLMDLSDYSWKYCQDNGRSTGAYMMIYQGGKIDHGTHFPVPVYQSSAESEYNAACNKGMALSYFRMLVNELLSKDPYIVLEEAPIIIFNIKPAVCMAKISKDTKHTRQITRRLYLVKNDEK